MLTNMLRPKPSKSKSTRASLVIAALAVVVVTYWLTPNIPLGNEAERFAGTTGLDVAHLASQPKKLQNERFDTH
jgi:hypothetical protein